MKKEFIKKFAANIKQYGNEVKSVKLNDLPFGLVEDFKNVLGFNSISGLDLVVDTKCIMINPFIDDKEFELRTEMLEGKDIEIYDFNFTPTLYNPKSLLQGEKPIVTPSLYDLEKFTPYKCFIIPFTNDTDDDSEQSFKLRMIATLMDMLENPDKYAAEYEYGIMIRFKYKNDDQLKYSLVDLQEDFFIPIKK